MKTRVLTITSASIALAILVSTLAFGEQQGASEAKAIAELAEQIALIEKISPHVERIDLARLFALKRSSLDTIEVIRSSKDLGNGKVLMQYQRHIMAFNSPSFLRLIPTERTQAAIQRLAALSRQIAVDREITHFTFIATYCAKMRQLITFQLDKLPIKEQLRLKLNGLIPTLADAIAHAEAIGDRPSSFERAKRLYLMLNDLYPALDEVAPSDAAFEIVMELQGLNEILGDYAEANLRTGAAGGNPK